MTEDVGVMALCSGGSAYSLHSGASWNVVSSPADSDFENAGGAGELVPMSETQFVWIQTNKQGLWHSSDAGLTWTRINLRSPSGDIVDNGGLNYAYYLKRRICAPDGWLEGVAYIAH